MCMVTGAMTALLLFFFLLSGNFSECSCRIKNLGGMRAAARVCVRARTFLSHLETTDLQKSEFSGSREKA